MGIAGDSWNNVLGESNNASYKAETIRPHGELNGTTDLDFATPHLVDWFDKLRLHRLIGMILSSEVEAN